MRVCEVCGRTSEETKIIKGKYGILCNKHYLQCLKYGEVRRSVSDRNDYVIHEDYAEIILRDKYCNEIARTLIDLEDVEKCKPISWNVHKSSNGNYVMGWVDLAGAKKKIFIHRFLMGYFKGSKVVDHVNRNPLDNRKQNLRIVTQSENCRNQGLHRKGILKTPSGKFSARITVNYKEIFLGTFPTHEEALKARLDFEKTL